MRLVNGVPIELHIASLLEEFDTLFLMTESLYREEALERMSHIRQLWIDEANAVPQTEQDKLAQLRAIMALEAVGHFDEGAREALAILAQSHWYALWAHRHVECINLPIDYDALPVPKLEDYLEFEPEPFEEWDNTPATRPNVTLAKASKPATAAPAPKPPAVVPKRIPPMPVKKRPPVPMKKTL